MTTSSADRTSASDPGGAPSARTGTDVLRSRTDGVQVGPDEGRRIEGGGIDARVLTTLGEGAFASIFSMTVPPGYDVGAHVHAEGQEIFYVTHGRLDILALEPVDRSVGDWHEWAAPDGRTYLSGGPGSFLWVPTGVPHAFGNSSGEEARMLFMNTATINGGHEHHFAELAEILSADGEVDARAVEDLGDRYGVQRLTGYADGR